MRLIAFAFIAILGWAAQALAGGQGAVGLYGGVCDSPEQTAALIAKCKANGIGTLLPSLSGGGTAIWKTDKAQYYPSLKARLDAGYDALAELIRQAHAAGIKVVPSVAVGPGGRMLEAHPEWETLDREGRPSGQTTTASISFAYPEARKAKVALLMDLVNGYDIDGILLDYCRYPENSKSAETKYGFYGYDQPLIEACSRLYGFDPRQEPIDSPNWTTFNRMRADTVTAFVKELADAVHSSGKQVGMAGFGDTDPDLEARSCGRDWGAWGRRGLIEDFYLATYVEKGEQMTAAARRAREALGPKVRIHSALAPFNNFITTPQQMMDGARALLAGGSDGLWIYREDFLDKLNLWDAVRAVNEELRERAR